MTADLAARDAEILRLTSQGETETAIATRLGVTVNVVKNVRKLAKKLAAAETGETQPESNPVAPDADVPFHPLSELFPLIEGAEFSELAADIKATGLRERIILDKPRLLGGRILDGRNRFRACRAAGVAPLFDQVKPGADLLAFVLSKNLHRRHLSESQRAMVAAKIANLPHGGDRRSDQAANLPLDPPHPSAPQPPSPDRSGVFPTSTCRDAELGNTRVQRGEGITQASAAELLHVSERSVRTAREVVEHGAPELREAVERGQASVSAAADIATLPIEEQKRIVASADPQAIRAAAKAIRAGDQAEKRQRREAREAELSARIVALPEKRYGVILADPEWRFEPYSRASGMDRAADNHYPTSGTDIIAARPVAEIAAQDCVLFLWATAPMLPDALAVMAAWGFGYRSHFIWHKGRAGTGYWNRNEHELLLVGARGSPVAPAMGDQWPSVLAAPSGAHSAKPACFHELIESYFPTLPKIELNARRARPGWDAWGFEAPSHPAPSPSPQGGGERAEIAEGEAA